MSSLFKPTHIENEKEVAQPHEESALRLMSEPDLPIPLRIVNQLSEGAKRRIYRTLIPPNLLVRFAINPITWKGPQGDSRVQLIAPAGSQSVKISARHQVDAADPFAYLELADNKFNSIDILLLVLNDPASPRFRTDHSVEGGRTLFGTVNRNLAEEEQAMAAGLAPAQIRAGLRASSEALQHLEAFLAMLGHSAFYVEPLTYADAWLFERRGFSYVSGRRLMERINAEFQPGGQLYQALDNSIPFRRPEQARTVRGRAWAIHDGILSTIDARWNNVRMVKRLGHHAGVESFPGAVY